MAKSGKKFDTIESATKYLEEKQGYRRMAGNGPLRRIHLSTLGAITFLLSKGYTEKDLCETYDISPQAFIDLRTAQSLKESRLQIRKLPKLNNPQLVESHLDEILLYVEEIKKLVLELKKKG